MGDRLARSLLITQNILIQAFRARLREKDKVVSGKTSKSIRGKVITIGGGFHEILIRANESLLFIERGRKPGGKFPPKKILLRWIRARKITGKDSKGKRISKDTLYFIIAASIVRKGIKPVDIINAAVDKSRGRLTRILRKAIGDDLKEDTFRSVKF